MCDSALALEKKREARKRMAAVVVSAMMVGLVLLLYVLYLNSAGIPVSKLMRSPESYDCKRVVVVGNVCELKQRISRNDNLYFTFRLTDASHDVTVFSFGKASVRNGDRVKVVGRFAVERHVGEWIFRNEIDASRGSIAIVNTRQDPFSCWLTEISRHFR